MLGLLDLRKLRLARSLAKLALLARTMLGLLGLLDLRRWRLTRSLTKLALLVQTMLGLRRLRLARLLVGLASLAKAKVDRA